ICIDRDHYYSFFPLPITLATDFLLPILLSPAGMKRKGGLSDWEAYRLGERAVREVLDHTAHDKGLNALGWCPGGSLGVT
ncbi:hypothetical protein Bpfe_026511, partial [Biomphalaria pfeifferi]